MTLGCVLLSLAATGAAAGQPPAPQRPRPLPPLDSLTVEPAEILLGRANRQQQLLVSARTAAGRVVDVTHLCALTSSETAVALAEVLAGDRGALLRIDCNTLAAGSAAVQLLGPPPGYAGYVRGQGGLLGRLRDRPESVVLFDKIEKADPALAELLQVIDNGRVEDAEGA
jgi:hypothetical protein